MKVSVAITTYNGSKYLTEQLDCIRLQTRPADEVLIVDDCSEDMTKDIVSKYICDYQLTGWELYENESTIGWRKNTITALTKARGDIVFYCDQDDVWPLDKIDKMTRMMEDRKDCLILASDCVNFDTGQEVEAKFRTESAQKRMFDKKWFYIRKPGAAFAIRHSLLNKLSDFYEDELATDLLLWHLAILENGLYIYDYCGVYRRRHGNNVTKENTHDYLVRKQYAKEAIEHIEVILKYYKNHYAGDCDYRYRKRILNQTLKFKIEQVKYFDKLTWIRWVLLVRYIAYYGKTKSWITDGKMRNGKK